ncbi:MAG: Pirin-like protein [Alteromonadaceae bacterium]|nr:Pirin-like protein [Alteromonadaceae bacterium]|tara:strand:- start:413 stop:1093 length:681 start_codon:yes stop_codon:yes gene_type:complete
MNKDIRIIDAKNIPLSGFAGIVEKRMVMSPKIWPQAIGNEGLSQGLDDFLYLSYGHFKPSDGAPMHSHVDVDIVSVIINGKVGHKGSLGDGTIIEGPGVQVQRAGKGMTHSEFSVLDEKADFIQMWFNPPAAGLQPGYYNYSLEHDELVTVLGGENETSFNSNMRCQVGFIAESNTLTLPYPFICIIFQGNAQVGDKIISTGQLIEGSNVSITARERLGLAIVATR